jgi:hypothetical protein
VALSDRWQRGELARHAPEAWVALEVDDLDPEQPRTLYLRIAPASLSGRRLLPA